MATVPFDFNPKIDQQLLQQLIEAGKQPTGLSALLGQGLPQFQQSYQQSKQNKQQKIQKEETGKTINSFLNNPNIPQETRQQLAPFASIAQQYPEVFASNILPKLIQKPQSGQSVSVGPDGQLSIGGQMLPGQEGQAPSPMQPQPPQQPMTAGVGGMMGPGGGPPPPMGQLQRKPLSIPITGNKAVELLLNKGQNQNDSLRQQYINMANRRTDVMEKSLNSRQINNLAKSTGLQPTVVKQLQTNNIRADRALDILNDPRATWQALNSWVSTDFAGIMQGGAPHKDQILNTEFPNYRAKLAQIQTYLSTQPQGPIPEGFRDYMRHFVKSIKTLDNDYLWKNAKYQGNMMGPTIQGGKPFVDESKNFTKQFMKGAVDQNSEKSSSDGWSYLGPVEQ